ncbi:MAG: hypothetical protein Q9225_000288 [Loekoesia sp. 1 TL-2023]
MPAHTSTPLPQIAGRAHQALRGGSQTLQEAVDRLNQASSSISAALDPPPPRTASPDVTAQEYLGEAAVNDASRQRAKRRRLNDGLLAKEFGPNYGYRGQIVPGPLRMEIVFCDGGLHEYGKEKYRPENVLRNDLSVYCTRSSKCDLVLRHEGGAPFCLQKLVIKAPETGFTAPIQEGIVFVAMDLEGLILKASRYTIRESASPSPPSSPSSPSQSPDLPTHRYSAHDQTPHGDPVQRRPPSRRRAEDGSERFIPPPISTSAYLVSPHENGSNARQSLASQTRNAGPQNVSTGNISSVQSHFNVSIDCDNHSDDEEEESSEATLADRHYRDRIPSAHDSSDEIEDPDFANYVHRAGLRHRYAPGNWRHRRRTVPRPIGLDEPSGAEDGSQTKEGADVLVPHATIFIEKEKSIVSVKFEPAV